MRCPAFVQVLDEGEVSFCEGEFGDSDCEVDVDWLILDEGFDIEG